MNPERLEEEITNDFNNTKYEKIIKINDIQIGYKKNRKKAHQT